MIFLFDIDGTLADASHRLPLIQEKPPNWEAFFAAAGEDAPIWEVISIARALYQANHKLIMVTGRSETIRDLTLAWLGKYRIPHNGLFMRKAGDHRQDNIVKSEILDEILKLHHDGIKIGGVFEDRQQVVDMYRERGLRVFQVAEGKF